jgi:hypothetical protein
MANVYRNISIHRLNEILGEQPTNIKTRSGKTILVNQPFFDDPRECTEIEEAHQDALREATTYANFARRQDVYLHKARANDVTAYSIAILDWFGAPKVLHINFNTWTGKPGELIHLKARDNIRVAGVSLVIRDPQGNVLESGEAVPCETRSGWWDYITKSHIAMEPFPSLEAIAWDLAGNCDSFTIS